MIPAGAILLIFAAVSIVTAIIVIMVIREKRRRQALEALAAKHGWSYERKEHGLASQYEHLENFGTGTSRKTHHVLRGTHRGNEFVFFEYQYTISSGKNSTTYFFRVADMATLIDGRDLKIEKETFGHKIGDALGLEDIDFESHEFSKKFWVKCRDRRFAYDIIHPQMMEFLLPQTHWLWQWSGYHIVLMEQKTVDPKSVMAQLDRAADFIDLIPRHRIKA